MDAPQSEPRFRQALAAIDRLNGSDPRSELCNGVPRPREVVYSERLSACLERLYPDASEVLRVAARAQHICRWQIARDGYPTGRAGYNAWRSACRDHHATLATGILRACGYPDSDIAQVAKLIRKEDLKQDPESQALENVVGVVFIEHYVGRFVADHPDYHDGKLVDILRKTMRKLDPAGHTAIRALDMPATVRRLVDDALASGG